MKLIIKLAEKCSFYHSEALFVCMCARVYKNTIWQYLYFYYNLLYSDI